MDICISLIREVEFKEKFIYVKCDTFYQFYVSLYIMCILWIFAILNSQ